MAATQVAESDEENNNHSPWKEILRKMLPPGAPTPDQDHLDYSIAVEYHGPLPSHPLPKVNPINFDDSSSKVSHFFRSESVAKEFQLKNLVNANGIDSSHCLTNDSETNSNLDSNSLFSSQIRPNSENLVFRREDMKLSESHLNANENEVEIKKVKFDSETEMKSDDDDDDDDDGRLSQCSSIASVTALPVVQGERKRNKKRGICSRCGKGNRLSEREICIVCNAKYCSCCLIKAMGSMPEGRKCVGCIGQPIDESKRECLGKVSKILKKVCSSLEVKQITRAERECFANQLRPEQLVVNGRHVVAEEMVELLGCWMPPQNLKPGKYWYDKDSGLWGKEGEKPDKIISSKLNVGGKLQASASNGNTKVFFNGREITKVELRVLKLAKVQCPEATHFWVYDDGSYEEEGQNNIKGNIWEKASTRFLSSLLSLPVPPGKFDGPKDDSTLSSDRLEAEYPEHKRIHKFLLFGLSGSGTSTIFKQAKFLYGDKFTPEELQNIKLMIQSNLYKYLGVLLEGREGFEEESLMKGKDAVTVDLGLLPDEENQCVYSMNPRLKEHADWLLEIMTTGDLDAFFPAATREYAPLVEELWQHRSIQETYRRRGELNFLTDAAKYFLDRAVEISSNDYEPSEKDIIYAEGVTQTNGLVSVEFSFDDRNTASVYYDETVGPLPTLTTYQLVRINSSGLNYGCKWLELFEDVRAVIFCVALSDYDVMWATHFTDSTCNKMLASRDMFVSLVQHPSFRDIPCVLLMNKYDVFEQKISQVPLTVCEWFEDFCPAKLHSNYQSLAHQAYYYVAVKFKELYASVTGQKLYVYQTRALDRTSVNEALIYVQEVIKWDEARDDFLYSLMADDSFDSTDLM